MPQIEAAAQAEEEASKGRLSIRRFPWLRRPSRPGFDDLRDPKEVRRMTTHHQNRCLRCLSVFRRLKDQQAANPRPKRKQARNQRFLQKKEKGNRPTSRRHYYVAGPCACSWLSNSAEASAAFPLAETLHLSAPPVPKKQIVYAW